MSGKVKWIVAGVLCYLAFLVYNLPAKQVLGRLTLPENIQVSGVEGRIWEGKARIVTVNGMAVDNVRWELGVLPMLLGDLSFDLVGGNSRASDEISFNGPLSVSMLNKNQISAQEFDLFLPSGLVIAQLPLPLPVNAGGRFRIQIDDMNFDQTCQNLAGKGQWLNASLIGLGEPLQLGNFDADLRCEEGVTLIDVKEPNSFGLSAVARVEDMQVSVEGRFKPAEDLPKQVHDAARFFGEPDAQGYYELIF